VSGPPRARWLAAIGLITIAAAVHVTYYFTRVVDDMFIFLRYAENLAHGHGPVYNLGQRVEGFSSVTWTVAIAIGEVLGANLVTWTKVMGVVSLGALLVGQYYFVTERLGVSRDAAVTSWRRLLPLLAPAFTACCCYIVSWSMYGLETPLYLALLVWTAVALGRYVTAPSRRRLVIAGVIAGSFALSRPEAPMMFAAIALGLALTRIGVVPVRRHLAIVATGAAPGAAIFVAYLLFRRWYFGLWQPHTYYTKGAESWHSKGFGQILGAGASVSEAILIVGGIAIAAWVAWRRRDAVGLALAMSVLVFVSKVQVDWMPNARYWLPMWVVMPMVWLCLIDRLWVVAPTVPMHFWRIGLRAMSLAAAAVVVSTMVYQARVDTRYSVFGFRGRGSKHWTSKKSLAGWRTSLRALRRQPPAELAKTDKFNMGMVTQTFHVIESDPRPLAETWFIGHDIGLVGYATPVNIWEIPGLFTPDIRHHQDQLKRHMLPADLIASMIDRPVVMTEIFDKQWLDAVRANPEAMRRFEPVSGWTYFREHGPRPTSDEIQRRYRAAVAKLPSSYYITELYGRALGASFDFRAEVVRSTLAQLATPGDQPPPCLPVRFCQ
jgi:hypothetical protein